MEVFPFSDVVISPLSAPSTRAEIAEVIANIEAIENCGGGYRSCHPLHGQCVKVGGSFGCACNIGYGGEECRTPLACVLP